MEKNTRRFSITGVLSSNTLSLSVFIPPPSPQPPLPTVSNTCSVVILGRSTCPFCAEVHRALSDRLPSGGRKHVYYRLDKLSNGATLHAVLKAKTGQASVPYVFVNGNLVGGCTDVKAGEYDGRLAGILGELPGNMAATDIRAPNRCVSNLNSDTFNP